MSRPSTRSIGIAISLAITCALAGGCATSWAITQVTGTQRAWDEGVREEVVPLPGVEERLTVHVPLAIEYEQTAPTTSATGPSATGHTATPLPFAVRCSVEQRARDAVYRSAFRYGSRWKKSTVAMALIEGALATAFLVYGDPKSEDVLYGGFFAVDAVATAALIFAPRKEIYRKDERPLTTQVRSDCPDGLVIEIAGDSFPIDAVGRLGELGDAALADWMAAPVGPVHVRFGGDTRPLRLGTAEVCAWHQFHNTPQVGACPAYGGIPPRATSAMIVVPAGTLTHVAEE